MLHQACLWVMCIDFFNPCNTLYVEWQDLFMCWVWSHFTPSTQAKLLPAPLYFLKVPGVSGYITYSPYLWGRHHYYVLFGFLMIKLSYLSKITRLFSSKARIWTTVWFLSSRIHCFYGSNFIILEIQKNPWCLTFLLCYFNLFSVAWHFLK